MAKRKPRAKQLGALRREVAVEAARIMAEDGLRNHLEAKLRAAERLGLASDAALPRNKEIEAAFREHLMLFKSDSQPQLLRELRQSALNALRFFDAFEPRLVGAVLDGSADEFSAVCLQVFTDTNEEVGWHLDQHAIPFDIETRRIRMAPDSDHLASVYQFVADEHPIDITVLPRIALRQAPLSGVDARPMQRASLKQLVDDEAWLNAEDSAALGS